jgi:hypothetical protein
MIEVRQGQKKVDKGSFHRVPRLRVSCWVLSSFEGVALRVAGRSTEYENKHFILNWRDPLK